MPQIQEFDQIAPDQASTPRDSLAEVLGTGAEVEVADVKLHRHWRARRIAGGRVFLIAFTLQGLKPARAGWLRPHQPAVTAPSPKTSRMVRLVQSQPQCYTHVLTETRAGAGSETRSFGCNSSLCSFDHVIITNPDGNRCRLIYLEVMESGNSISRRFGIIQDHYTQLNTVHR
jgi:hypothetical protein